jgi:predicted RNA-binding Zn ribbon-like protein
MRSEIVAGKLCLAFADTARAEDKHEELNGMGDLLQWATKAGVLSSADGDRLAKLYEGNRRQATSDLARTVAVRDLLRAIFTGIANGRPLRDRDIAELNSALAQTPALLRVSTHAGAVGIQLDSAAEGLPKVLFEVLADTVNLLASDRRVRIRECASDECTMLFVDESRNGSRRWCDMNVCGNRMKARRHYARARRG